MQVNHTLKPIYDKSSKILILGTMPSSKSREVGFYYGHPQNRFWKVLSDVLEEPFPFTKEEKIGLLRKHHIALWDVLESCDIKGSSDSSIKNPKPNDIGKLIKDGSITKIFTTGKQAERLYNKFILKTTNIPCVYLPSTSPANQAITYEELKKRYEIIKKHLN